MVRTNPAGTETREWARVKAGNRAASLRWGKVAGHAGDGLEVLVGSGLPRRHHQRDQRLTPDRYQSGVLRSLGVSLAFRVRLGWSERPGRLYRVHPRSTQAQHMAPADMLRHARAVRERIRTDPGIPGWARRSLPLLWIGQRAAIAVHVGLERKRGWRAPRR